MDAPAGAAGTQIGLDGVCRWLVTGDTVVKAVDDLNPQVDEAAFALVLRRSGSGTALLNVISSLDAPTANTTHPDREVTTASIAERALSRPHTVSLSFRASTCPVWPSQADARGSRAVERNRYPDLLRVLAISGVVRAARLRGAAAR